MALVNEFTVKGRAIGSGRRPYLIAEIGSNFDQSMDRALKLMDAMAEAGADAVKFQLFRADAMQPPGSDLHKIFKSLELNPDWVPDLAREAEARGMAFLASAFDLQSLQVLEAAGAAAHKVASSETVNAPLLDAMARTGKPLFLATGMCDLVDVAEAVQLCRQRGNETLSLMQCLALYPLPPESANLRVMDLFAAAFGGPVGFSDHSLGITLALAAAARGACVIEKHVTLDRNAPGPDHFYALEPQEVAALVKGLGDIHAALGPTDSPPVKELHPEERATGRREGLYAARDIAEGAAIAAADLEAKRPATGLRARYRDWLIGARANRPLARGEAVDFSDITFQEPKQGD